MVHCSFHHLQASYRGNNAPSWDIKLCWYWIMLTLTVRAAKHLAKARAGANLILPVIDDPGLGLTLAICRPTLWSSTGRPTSLSLLWTAPCILWMTARYLTFLISCYRVKMGLSNTNVKYTLNARLRWMIRRKSTPLQYIWKLSWKWMTFEF